ncbi:hypothetical protein DSS3PM1_00099 [Bacteriophage DSS3_PM1]|nr:hypothetical protein DSS3PM1_00099 [Bacteriophage DSS3_PM1]
MSNTVDRNKLNTVQAKHHQLVPGEELERALAEGRDIGFNDLAAHIGAKCHPYLGPTLSHALKYQTRFGRKDDERQEVEKAIWYLMDLHNRIADLNGEKRDFAPWRHMGKLSQLDEIKRQMFEDSKSGVDIFHDFYKDEKGQ